MSNFEITVDDKTYSGHLVTYSFSYKIVLFIEDFPVGFEPDEERNFRAIVPPEGKDIIKPGLLKLLSEELQKIFNDVWKYRNFIKLVVPLAIEV